MTTSDGRVIGVTQIAGSASRSEGFNVVLLAEGFTEDQQDDFDTAASDFVTALLATDPFDTLRGYINVFAVNVASTESGADDPVAAGGTGATANTYFDASFGGNGIRRLLICDNGTALSVATTQVPEHTLVLVVVNSTTYGGSGGSVGTYSLAGGATEIAVHESGHTAFGLADEYPYLSGAADETGHDHHPAGEPGQPNVTTDPRRANLKWSWAVDAATSLPTMSNPDCSTPDSRPSPVPAGTVGCFEGAHYYHCGAYRPEYTCKMRELGVPFCRVCRQTVLNTVRGGRTSTFLHLVYGGNEAEFVDSGIGRIGEMYGVAVDGPLRWYRFQGPPPNFSGSWYRWDHNSGNRIGRGWNGLSAVFSCGNGSLFGVDPGGLLRWYTYKGGGEDDPNVVLTQNWDAHSSNPIGNGWNGQRFLVGKPYEGNAIFRDDDSAIYAVDTAGNMRWFRYIGDGTADQSGHTGWAPNSGSTISTGWNRYQRLVAISDILLTVEADGTLRWHRYHGDGENGPSHWDPNSGNIIDRRDTWATAIHIFGGLDYRNGHIIFVVGPDRLLHWYCYTGNGEQDLAFAHWSAFSGSQIGNGW